MADAKKLLRALLAKAYKKQDTEIDPILSDDTDDQTAETILTGWDQNRVAELQKPKPGTTFQDGYKKAKAEVLTDLEGQIKTKFGIDEDLTGMDLIERVATKATPGEGSAKLTDDQVRAHPVYQTAEQAFKKQLKEKDTTWEAKLKEVETGYNKDKTFSTVSKKALEVLTGMNPVLPADPKVAQTWQNKFVDAFREYDYEVQDGNRIVVMKDGKVVNDPHGNSLEFEDLIKSKAPEFFEFKANNGGGNAGNGKPGDSGNQGGAGGNKGYPAGVVKPKTMDDLTKLVNDPKLSLDDRNTIMATYEAEHSAG